MKIQALDASIKERQLIENKYLPYYVCSWWIYLHIWNMIINIFYENLRGFL